MKLILYQFQMYNIVIRVYIIYEVITLISLVRIQHINIVIYIWQTSYIVIRILSTILPVLNFTSLWLVLFITGNVYFLKTCIFSFSVNLLPTEILLRTGFSCTAQGLDNHIPHEVSPSIPRAPLAPHTAITIALAALPVLDFPSHDCLVATDPYCLPLHLSPAPNAPPLWQALVHALYPSEFPLCLLFHLKNMF